jgi:hypothetical protein
MKGWSPFYFDGGFLIYTIMTYKFYDHDGNSLEVYKNYQNETIVIELEELNRIELDYNDIEDLIFTLNKLTNNQNFLWKTLSNN